MVKIINKKAQATIFIIVGIVILIAALIFLYVRQTTVEVPAEQEIEGFKPEFEAQSQLKDYVDNCLRPIVLEGLEILRLQGGYIDIPTGTETFTFKDSENKVVKEIDGSKKVLIDENAFLEVPYWVTEDEVAIPTLEFMEKELDNYVTRELDKCIADFEAFKEQNYEVTRGNIEAEVDLGRAVVVNVNLPITFRKENIEFTEDNFVFTVPIDLNQIHDLASTVAATEDSLAYLEQNTKFLISLYSGIDENRLPPFSQSISNFDCSEVNWQKENVKEMLKDILELNVKNLKIENTKYTLPTVETEAAKNIYEGFIYEFFDEQFPKVEINYSYRPEWDFLEYDIKPSSGSFLGPSTVRGRNIPLIPLICSLKYQFKYTMQYPIVVNVKDLASARIDPIGNVYFEDQGYSFQFPMVAYLCGNQNRECVGRTTFTPNLNLAGETLNVTLLPETLFCNPEQRTSNDITIKVSDALTNEALEDVSVNFYCGSYQNDCSIANTNSNGILKTKFPLCINGEIYFIKKDYAELRELLTVYNEPERTLEFFMSPLVSFSFEIKKIHLPIYVKNYFETASLELGNALLDIEAQDQVFLTATGPSPINYFFPDPESRKEKMGIGKYDVNLQALSNVNIAKSTKIVEGETVTLEGFKGPYPIGSFDYSFDVTKDDLKKSKVTFFVPVEENAAALSNTVWEEFDDPIIKNDGSGNLGAELLYQCGRFPDDSCDFNNCNFVAIDGSYTKNFNDNNEACQKAYEVNINKNQYSQFLKPKFS